VRGDGQMVVAVGAGLDVDAVRREMAAVRRDFRDLVAGADGPGLRRASAGTRWTNRQLLYHMLFGYLLVRALLVLVRVFGRLPEGASTVFARVLDAGRVPFHLVNYLGSWVGALVVTPARMPGVMDWVTGALVRRAERETGASAARGMRYPTTWDPFFREYMTLADIYRYPTQHFRFHQRQLTLGQAASPDG
jgi:hypothetical protein